MTPRPVVSDWLVVSQERIDRFADATGDHQWLHVDPARAQRESPYGATVAHGFLTLSLISTLLSSTSPFEGRMAVNYGLNRVRFIEPVIAGSRIRARFEPAAVEEEPDSQKVTWRVTVETDNRGPRPEARGLVCIAEWIVLYYS
ncbi:MAG TPA: MaoC family dehydratase [Thermoanaerobaculia bacterium]|nr:MaoC family dehydratase [Thermoanaerobaculia bacterium]